DGGGEDDAEHQPPVEPPLDKKPLQCVVLELSPVLIAHDRSPVMRARQCLQRPGYGYTIPPASDWASRRGQPLEPGRQHGSWGGATMLNHSLDQPPVVDRPVRVEVITYVPTQFNH